MPLMNRHRLKLSAYGATWAAFWCLSAAALADEPWLAGILTRIEDYRRRSEFAEAERLCEQTLADSQLSVGARADVVLAWSQTLLEHALYGPPGERDDRWRRAHEAARRFALEHPRHPQLVQVQVQAALATLARGETVRQQSELSPNDRELAAAARDALRQAVREFRAQGDAVDAQLRQRVRQPPDKQALTDEQLVHLQRQIQLQLARALRNQGQCYAAQSPERSDALDQALALVTPLAALDDRYPVAWPARFEQLTALRLLQDFAACGERLSQWAQPEPPAEWGPRLRAEAVRLALDQRDFAAAAELIERPPGAGWSAAPELDMAELELWLATARSADGADRNAKLPPGDASVWQAKASRAVARIEASHGPYWSGRAESLLASGGTIVTGAMSGEALAKTADGLVRAGRWEEALAAYDAAAQRARDAGQSALAFDYSYKAATALHGQKSHATAAERFRRLALDQWDHPRAAEAHLLAIFNTAQLPVEGTTAPRMIALLEEHLRHWPQAPSASEVRWQLGRQQQRQEQWQAAIEAYRGVAASHPRAVEAVRAAGDCYSLWLAQLERQSQATAGVADAAWQYFVGLTLDDRGQPRDRLEPREIAAARAAAELRLEFDRRGAASALALLERAMANSEQDYAALLGVWVWAQAALGRDDQIQSALPHLAQAPPDNLLTLLSRLDNVCAGLPDDRRAGCDIARLELARQTLARRQELTAAQQREFDRLYARALASAGQTEAASAYFDKLSAAHPRDASIVAEHARFLSQRNDQASWEAALAKWRQLERGSRPPAARWFEAKYELAHLHLRLGNSEQAAKIITVTRALHPDLGGPEWKAKFLQLFERVQR